MKKISLLLVVAAVWILAVGTARAADDLMRFVPPDWPVVVRVDASANTASGAYLKSVAEKADYQDIKQLNQSFATGVSRLLRALGINLGAQEGLLPWWAERVVIGVDPVSGKDPAFVVALASRDRAAAETAMSELIGSVLRDSDPVVREVAGARVTTWKIPDQKIEPAYAIGDGFVLFADSASRIQAALTSDSGKVHSLNAALDKHQDDLLAFAVNLEPIAGKMMPDKAEGSEDEGTAGLLAMAASQLKADGGVALNEHGVVLSVNGDLPPMLMMMLSSFVPAGAAKADIAKAMPREALACVALASADTLPADGITSALSSGANDPFVPAALLAASAGNVPVGAALMAIVPQPSLVVVAQASSEQQAARILGALQDALRARKFTVTRQGSRAKLTHKEAKGAGYIAQTGSKVIYASDLRSMQKAEAVTPENSLASRAAFSEVNTLVGGPQIADAWIGLDAISAIGYMYEGLVGRDFAVLRPLLDTLKGTEGIGLSVGTTESGATLKLGVKTTIAPQSPLFSAYVTAAPAITAAILFPVFARAREAAQDSVSLSNLKQLAVAVRMYTDDHDGLTPPSKTWMKALEPYVQNKDVFKSPTTGQPYVYNYKVAGLKLKQIEANPSELIVFFEGNPGVPVGPEALSWGADGTVAVAYLDGLCKRLTEAPPMDAFRAITKPVKPAKK
ncbi:MAG: hypothetical protein IT209_03280 [Armatimonadetes bacterium]|nr:hypothetical protein [Armatimonadota bacterium]